MATWMILTEREKKMMRRLGMGKRVRASAEGGIEGPFVHDW